MFTFTNNPFINFKQENKLDILARKLNMNSDIRRHIFKVIMTCYDINDAYDRLMRLDLRGNT